MVREKEGAAALRSGHRRTTVMIRNIFCRYTQEEVKRLLDQKGLKGMFDAVYMPRSMSMRTNLGYTFVSFRREEYAERCRQVCSGRRFGKNESAKICEVVDAHIQGGEVGAWRGRKKRSRAKPLIVDDMPDGRDLLDLTEATKCDAGFSLLSCAAEDTELAARSFSSTTYSSASSSSFVVRESASRGPPSQRPSARRSTTRPSLGLREALAQWGPPVVSSRADVNCRRTQEEKSRHASWRRGAGGSSYHLDQATVEEVAWWPGFECIYV